MNEVDFNPQFVSRMIPKLEWSALVQAAEEVNLHHDSQMPVTASVQAFHALLLTTTHFTIHKIAVIDKCHVLYTLKSHLN